MVGTRNFVWLLFLCYSVIKITRLIGKHLLLLVHQSIVSFQTVIFQIIIIIVNANLFCVRHKSKGSITYNITTYVSVTKRSICCFFQAGKIIQREKNDVIEILFVKLSRTLSNFSRDVSQNIQQLCVLHNRHNQVATSLQAFAANEVDAHASSSLICVWRWTDRTLHTYHFQHFWNSDKMIDLLSHL